MVSQFEPLPEDFLFGVGNSDHQVEAYDSGFVDDIRDVWDRRAGFAPRRQATDFWNRYPEDIQLAQQLGCKMFRFSVSWTRVETAPGQFNEAALDHYRQVAQTIRDAGMEPMVTLHHFVWPLHLEAAGGMIGDDFPALFSRYAAKVAEHIGDIAHYWITVNEPNILMFGFLKPWWQADFAFPPGMPKDATIGDQLDATAKLIRSLFLAHTQARAAIKARIPQAKVGANPAILGLPMWLQNWINGNASRLHDPDDWKRKAKRLAEPSLLETGQVDMVIATLTKTEQREQQIDFSEVYYLAGQTLLVKQNSAVQSLADLRQKDVVVVKSSTAEARIRQLIPEAVVRVADDYPGALNLIDFEKATAILADNTILLGIIKQHPGIYRLVGGLLTNEPYAVAITKGNVETLNYVDLAIHDFAEREWVDSFTRNFPGEDVPAVPVIGRRATMADLGPPSRTHTATIGPVPLAAEGTLLRRIQDRGSLIVAVKADVPGFGYRNPDTGEYSGIEIDLARSIAQFLLGDPSKVSFRSATTPQRIPLLRSLTRFFDPILRYYSILASGLLADWWHLGMAGKLPAFLCPPECIGQQDFVGFDYYWGINTLQLNRVQQLAQSLSFGAYDRAPVWPDGLRNIIKFHADLFPSQEIFIVENGSIDEADGIARTQYLEDHLRSVQRARHEGANVKGYVCWSLTTNREWGAKVFDKNTDFGLFHIALDEDPALKRVSTEATEVYARIIRNRGV